MSESTYHDADVTAMTGTLGHVGAPVGLAHRDGTLLYANPALCALAGRERDDLEGRRLSDIASAALADVSAMFEHPRHEHVEVVVRRPDGSDVWALLSTRTMHSRASGPLVVAHLQDISPQRRAEQLTDDSLADHRRTLVESVLALARAAELRDPYTAGHQRATAEIAEATARQLGLDDDRVEGIRLASAIHDLGKLAVPAELLTRPVRLNSTEFDLIKVHSQLGHDVVDGIAYPWPLKRMIVEHHERLDGSGYPRCLVGDEILLDSRILSVADVLEAVTAHRPYRPSLGVDRAFQVLCDGVGSLFDGDVVDACIRATEHVTLANWPNRTDQSFDAEPDA